jgi:hypothetical protein
MKLNKSYLDKVLDESKSKITLNLYNAGAKQDVVIPLPEPGMEIVIALSRGDRDPQINTNFGSCKKKLAKLLLKNYPENARGRATLG